MTVSSARGPCGVQRVADSAERRERALVGLGELVRVQAHVELRDVKAEQLDAPAQIGQVPVGNARAAVGAQARVHQLEVGEQPARVGVARLGSAVEQVVETLPDETQLAAIGLVEVLVADLGRERRELALVALDRAQQLVTHGHHARGHADGAGEPAHLDAVARQREPARAIEPLRDGVRPCFGIAVLIASHPGAEAQRRRGAGQALAIVGEHVRRDVEQRRLEEPQRVADLVDHPRAPGAHLVGLPEGGDLRDDLVLEAVPRRRGERGVVECLEDAAELQLGLQHRAARGLGGMRGDHELERDVARAPGKLGRLHAALGQLAERLGERFPRDALLALVATPAAHAMPRLGDVGELEVEPERAQDSGRALLSQCPHAGRQRRLIGRRAGVPGLARKAPHALDVGQQILADLLDEHAPERVADQADVAPERVVGPDLATCGRIVGGGARHGSKPMGSDAAARAAIDRQRTALRANLALRVARNPVRAGAEEMRNAHG